MSDPVIRPYAAEDREAVRRICFETGFMGESVEPQWRERESFADLFTSYYTDREPESALVVEIDGVVQGYLLGCVDSARATKQVALAASHVARRGLALRPGTAGIVWRSAADTIVDAVRRRGGPAHTLVDPDRRWPAHLHIDLLPPARGQGAGTALVHRWFDTLRSRNIAGCHLQTMLENTAAVAFFESLGFVAHGEPELAPGLRAADGTRLHLRVMVKDLFPPA